MYEIEKRYYQEASMARCCTLPFTISRFRRETKRKNGKWKTVPNLIKINENTKSDLFKKKNKKNYDSRFCV